MVLYSAFYVLSDESLTKEFDQNSDNQI